MKIYEFIVAVAILTLMPGPDILYVLSQSVIEGAKRGVLIAAGLCSGLIVHTLLVALGVGAIISANETIFNTLKFAGAAYLTYLAIDSLLDIRRAKKEASEEKPEQRLSSNFSYYKRGIMMNLLNPKIIIFFLGIFPPFITDSENGFRNTVILGGLFIVISFSIFSLVAMLAGEMSRRFLKVNSSSPTLAIVKAVIYLGIASLIFA